MNTIQLLEYQEDKTPKPRHILMGLLLIDALVIGGLIALLIMNFLFRQQMEVYAAHNMAAASVLLDHFLDDSLLYYVGYIGATLFLILITCVTGLWMISEHWTFKHSIAAITVILLMMALWFGLGRSTPVRTAGPPATTPTPVQYHP